MWEALIKPTMVQSVEPKSRRPLEPSSLDFPSREGSRSFSLQVLFPVAGRSVLWPSAVSRCVARYVARFYMLPSHHSGTGSAGIEVGPSTGANT